MKRHIYGMIFFSGYKRVKKYRLPVNRLFTGKTLAFLMIYLFFVPFLCRAQDSVRISVHSRVQEKAVLLRWGATTPMAWQQTNRYGFRIERYTVLRNGDLLPETEKKILAATCRAKPLEDWEQMVVSDDYAAIIAQALYGEDFALGGSSPGDIGQIVSLSEQMEQRFALSLYAAERNFEAACMAGWGWRDTDVKPGEKYLYRIIPLVPPDIMVIDTGLVYTGTDDYEPLPQPLDLAAIFGDRSVMLAWDYSLMKDVYNSYYIEKSTDGKNFTRLPGLPVSNLNNRNEKTAQRMFFSDSLANNNQIYHYRICGIDAFGETGPPSEAVSGQGADLLVYVPHITRAVVNDRGVMELEWEFDDRGDELIAGFELNRSDDADNGFTAVQKNIAPGRRKTEYGELLPSNYFTVSAIPKHGAAAVSFPVLVQPLDTFPPAVPAGMTGVIDTTGVVTLRWAAGKEPDLLGYKVYRALRSGDEFLPLSDVAFRDTVYRDSVSLFNLNPRVYYTVSAVDMRYNHSASSPVLELVKPVMVPPSSPVFSGYRATPEGILLEWVNSPDETVAEHRLYRKERNDADSAMRLIQRFGGASVQSFTDSRTEPEKYYAYILTAASAGGLESKPSPSLTVFSRMNAEREIERFEAIPDKRNRTVRLTWDHRLPDVRIFEIYRSAGGAPPALWKTVPAALAEITDEDVSSGNYLYMIRAVFRDGKNSKTKNVTLKW